MTGVSGRALPGRQVERLPAQRRSGLQLNGWGPGCLSIEGANLVTADGELIAVNIRNGVSKG